MAKLLGKMRERNEGKGGRRRKGNGRCRKTAGKFAKKISVLSGFGLVLTWISGPRTSAYLPRQGMGGRGCNGWKEKIRRWEMKMPLAVYNASIETTKWGFRKSKNRRRGCERPRIDSRDGNAPRYLRLAPKKKKIPGTPMSNFHG